MQQQSPHRFRMVGHRSDGIKSPERETDSESPPFRSHGTPCASAAAWSSRRYAPPSPEEQVEQYLEDVPKAALDAIAPHCVPEVTTQWVGEKCLVRIRVHPGERKPYLIKSEGTPKGVYVRDFGRDEAMLRYFRRVELEGVRKAPGDGGPPPLRANVSSRGETMEELRSFLFPSLLNSCS